jgi:hypothetical protein
MTHKTRAANRRWRGPFGCGGLATDLDADLDANQTQNHETG